MKHVGKAIREYSSVGNTERPVPCIGFVSYARFHGDETQKNMLEHMSQNMTDYQTEQAEPFPYYRDPIENEEQAAIDPNHTHFVFIDNKNSKNRGWTDQIK